MTSRPAVLGLFGLKTTLPSKKLKTPKGVVCMLYLSMFTIIEFKTEKFLNYMLIK